MRSSRIAAAAGLAACALLVARRVGEAHAMLLSSEPAANARLTTPPNRIRLLFSEPVDASVSGIQLIAGASAPRDLKVSGDPHEVAALIAPVSALAVGGYRVVWRTVSADGHRIDGSFSFTIASDTSAVAPVAPPAMPATAEQPTPKTAAIARGVAMALIMALAGLLFFARGREATDPRLIAVCSWISIATVIAISGHFIAWSVNAAPDHRFDPTWIGKMTQTRQGMVEMARWAAAILAMWCIVVARKIPLGFASAVLALAVSAGIGHPAAIHPLVAVPTMAIHLAAGALWFGGLLWILLADRSDRDHFLRGVRRVSSIALWAVIAVFVTGVVQSLLLVQPITALFQSTYGWLLSAKVAAALALVLLGAYHRYRTVPRVETGPADFGASLRVELLFMAAVVMMAGLLSYLSPRGPAT